MDGKEVPQALEAKEAPEVIIRDFRLHPSVDPQVEPFVSGCVLAYMRAGADQSETNVKNSYSTTCRPRC